MSHRSAPPSPTHSTTPAARQRRGGFATGVATGAVLAAVLLFPPSPLRGSGDAEQARQSTVKPSPAQMAREYVVPERVITFEVTMAQGKIASESNDQMTILFAQSSADTPIAPKITFGDDILQEFSFSGFDVRGTAPFRFTRRVRDLSFLEARYIRLINHGGDGWAGGTISMSVDNQPILVRESMFPRSGNRKEDGIQDYNRLRWRDKTFWEADLQRIRRDVLRGK
jgi:hypothetical protein